VARRRSSAVLTTCGGILGLIVAGSFAAAGWTEEGVRIVVRWTAKLAAIYFAAAFSASSLQLFFRGSASSWLLANRRPLGLSFAMSHTLHLLALAALALAFPDPFVGELNAVTLVGGGLAYGFMFSMAATSTDAAVHRLGRARWQLLHTVGGWYIWLIFTQSYLPRAVLDPSYIPFAVLLVAVLVLRIRRRISIKGRRAQ
jgi:sulfoxide reductase heme-binding subunit YedZ